MAFLLKFLNALYAHNNFIFSAWRKKKIWIPKKFVLFASWGKWILFIRLLIPLRKIIFIKFHKKSFQNFIISNLFKNFKNTALKSMSMKFNWDLWDSMMLLLRFLSIHGLMRVFYSSKMKRSMNFLVYSITQAWKKEKMHPFSSIINFSLSKVSIKWMLSISVSKSRIWLQTKPTQRR